MPKITVFLAFKSMIEGNLQNFIAPQLHKLLKVLVYK
ncbi:hypothetical protein NIES22_29020 [Calothrix brevissima NIES-22]|nr:hypothetical protein NIES22_29020 [Calothrix brevissima NIES-22]